MAFRTGHEAIWFDGVPAVGRGRVSPETHRTLAVYTPDTHRNSYLACFGVTSCHAETYRKLTARTPQSVFSPLMQY